MGHIHAELMAQYAEDAKTHAEPWELWQFGASNSTWQDLNSHPRWHSDKEYRRKPKTHIVNGVEIPDLRIRPKDGQEYWYPDASTKYLVRRVVYRIESSWHIHRITNNLCYEPTEDGKQAAILHSKAWLGTAEQQPIGHDWDDQDKCRRCGDRDWYASATCTPKQQPSPDVSALVEALQAELETVKKVAYGNIELLERNEALQAECDALVEALEDIGASWHRAGTKLEKYLQARAINALATHRKQGGEL